MKINRIIKYFIISDLIFWGGWGLTSPIFAIFITDNIKGGSVAVAGLASAVYWMVKSLLRIPIGIFLDNRPGEMDDYVFLVSGLLIVAAVPFCYLFAILPWHIYLIQALQGVGMAMGLSGWAAIFTRHIDKQKEATEWGMDATFVGIGMGLSGAAGGWAVARFGFNPVFIAVGLIEILGVLILLLMKKDIMTSADHGMHFSFKEIFHK